MCVGCCILTRVVPAVLKGHVLKISSGQPLVVVSRLPILSYLSVLIYDYSWNLMCRFRLTRQFRTGRQWICGWRHRRRHSWWRAVCAVILQACTGVRLAGRTIWIIWSARRIMTVRVSQQSRHRVVCVLRLRGIASRQRRWALCAHVVCSRLLLDWLPILVNCIPTVLSIPSRCKWRRVRGVLQIRLPYVCSWRRRAALRRIRCVLSRVYRCLPSSILLLLLTWIRSEIRRFF